MSKHSPIRAARANPGVTEPMPPATRRARHDGWTPERQTGFLDALAASGCVAHAAAAVGMSTTSAYDLRAKPEAQAFRLGWDAALDLAVRQLADAVMSRAIHGVVRPIFYQGEQVGERRYFDERLAQFILRLRDPARFGKWRDAGEMTQHFDGPALLFTRLRTMAEQTAFEGSDDGSPALPDPVLLQQALEAMGVSTAADARAHAAANSDYDQSYCSGYIDGFEKAKAVARLSGAEPELEEHVDWYSDYLDEQEISKSYPGAGT